MKKRGFTLIELLAVIVILAIITLITIPIVLKTINNSEIESEKRSVEGYARAIEDDVANYLMMNPGKSYNYYVEEFNKGNINLDYKGNKVKCDPISINDNGKLILTGCFVYNDENELNNPEKIAKKNHYSYDGKKVSEVQNDNPSTPTKKTEYKIGDQITLAGEQYYVIADSGKDQDYVTALKANPLTKEEINTYGGVGTSDNHVNQHTYDNAGVAYDFGDANHTGGMQYYSSLGCKYGTGYYYTVSGCTNDYASSEVKYILNNWVQSKFITDKLKIVDGYSVRLIKFDELIENLGYTWNITSADAGSYPDVNTYVPNWVYNGNYWYWTMSTSEDSTTDVWVVYQNGGLGTNWVAYYAGAVRPVINVYKSKIQ